ncbi:hypothetical protein DID88_002795 [Monilinia fructigena]|uniref:Uncharacterized protein n=1 Tax=Monilinia fructigena TaxID=38457 RepID=A0A395IN41_9HELO|nr:hypothetical protein DID88_002795 [Monilinia fructigena]
MAPAPMTRPPAYKPQVVIDLTGEDEKITCGPVLPHSNHGLILPGTFPATVIKNSRPYSSAYNHSAPILPANSHSKETTMPTRNGLDYAPILPGATITNRYPQPREVPRSSDTFTTKRLNQPGEKDINQFAYQEPRSTIKNTSKRRRTMEGIGGGSSNQELQPTIGNALPRRRAMRQAQENGRFANERSYQDLHLMIENPPKRRRSMRGITEQESTQHLNEQAQDNENFAANQRNSMKAIPLPKKETSNLSEVPKPDRLAQILNDQVFVHIRAAMARHNRTISTKKLHDIGTSVAGVLVDNPMFENIGRYGGMLSREDEITISERARHYIDDFVAHSLALPAFERYQAEHKSNPDLEEREDIASDYNRDSTRNEKVKQANSILPPLRRSRRSRAQYDQAESSVSSIDVQSLETVDPPKTKGRKRASSQYVSNNAMQVDTHIDLIDLISSHDPTIPGQTIDGQPRPYIDASSRDRIHRGLERISVRERELILGRIYHIDFCEEELSIVRQVLQSQVRLKGMPTTALLMQKQKLNVPELVSLLMSRNQTSHQSIGEGLIHSRGSESLTAFLRDAAAGEVLINARTLRVGPQRPSREFSSLLRQREMHGMVPVRSCGGQRSYIQEINSSLEDSLQRKVEWTDCCGDIWAISWINNDAFVCGATAHSDSHNMQYNKPGNLVVGSVSKETLDAIPDHRIVRPIVNASENAENALESMRQTQDPWLYTSISAISHSKKSGLSFTASFDGTVKVWRVSPSDTGSSMDILGTWAHEGKVNFVTTSEHHDLVATASDVYNDAVRVYRLDEGNLSESPFDTYNGEKAAEQAQELCRKDLWAYYPATVQWGKLESVSHLLLVGYSPRSISNEEVDIPEDKKNSGELCLWNAFDGSKVPIASARTQNVFEVVWHPTKPAFIAATSPCGVSKGETKTQVRLFAARTDKDDHTAFYPIRVLDCPALDINELTVMPNSFYQCYVTASCTDGNTYVWDTGSIGDDAIHVLPHGESLDNPYHDLPRELADTGVKFAAWGKTSDRFYTGASDGRVKAWDIKRPRGKALVREVLAASGGIGAGAFSPDFSKLIIGDATGKVHLLTRSENDHELENSDLEDSPDSLRSQAGKLNHNLRHLRGPG